MAKSRSGDMTDALKKDLSKDSDVKFRTYKNDGKGFATLKEHESLTGVFVSVRDQEIRDRRTRQPKTIRVYKIRVDSGDVVKVGSRALLDSIFDDVMDEHGGYEVDPQGRYSGPAIKWLTDRIVRINRGTDTETTEGDEMGTYEFLVEE